MELLTFSNGVVVRQFCTANGGLGYSIVPAEQEPEELEKIKIDAQVERRGIVIADYAVIIPGKGHRNLSLIWSGMARALHVTGTEAPIQSVVTLHGDSTIALLSGDVTEAQWRAALERVEFK